MHISNLYKEGELQREGTVKEYLTVQYEGKRQVHRKVLYYNLDVIISVGYRVKSHQGTQFRIWATHQLKEYIIKGFVLNDERLKETGATSAYFDELLERIRDIRSSEKILYAKIKDIYTTAIDYDKDNPISIEFFKKVQNMMHWAIHRHTAAEIIYDRADANKQNMGLTSLCVVSFPVPDGAGRTPIPGLTQEDLGVQRLTKKIYHEGKIVNNYKMMHFIIHPKRRATFHASPFSLQKRCGGGLPVLLPSQLSGRIYFPITR